MDNLARNALLATQAGMSYGKWKAMQPVVVIEKRELPEGVKLCRYCGKEFDSVNNKKYCSSECLLEQRRKNNRESMKRCRQRGGNDG